MANNCGRANFDEASLDIFAVQDSISERVLAALTLKLSGAQQKRLTKRYTESVKAYELFMKGTLHAARLILPEARKGEQYFQQAIAIDPNFALAYAYLSASYMSFSLSGDIPETEAMPKAKAAALRAVELDETLAEAHVAVGRIAFWYDWDWIKAEKSYQRALELDPNNPAAYFFYAHLKSNLGRHEEAIEMGRRARELDPLSLITNSAEAQFLCFGGRYDEALARLEQTLELYPDFWHAHLTRSGVYLQKGMFAEALASNEKAALVSGGNSTAIAAKAYVLMKSGKPAEARLVLAELQKLSATHYVPSYNFAVVHDAIGEKDQAISYLRRGFAEKNVGMVFLKVDPRWANLRDDARFKELRTRMAL